MFHEIVNWIVSTVGALGYPGVIFLMFLESSFFPFPSEVVVPPAGYLAHQGQMNLVLVILSGILGSVLGALFNYWISVKLGRPFFEKYGKYFLVSSETLDKSERFFLHHGHISTFVGRLIPGLRQYISLPAGVARMPLMAFCAFTAAGAGIWVIILALVGYWLGSNSAIMLQYIHQITLGLLALCALLVAFYVFRIKKKGKRNMA
ncbi:DedA family protein [Dethiosulfovibrio salsuginis]|uniref:Membrane protein DedA, SNARE-associated domain n=1 Tax=Dethiosulfovibrio salsuginis TaxID=561720 RepID=A0A1X7IWW7_9BACT|nr:DedA family protein [Dethiosulfovibrio salsuginis]SMG19742.1 membrane protein DedA, SNARE-associated domain [Dethiosulfovibrio salsuginis]